LPDVPEHEITRTLTEAEIIPEHERRTESEEFRRNRALLLRQGHRCWICGDDQDLEAHHIFEWSLWNALDPQKALETLRAFDPYGFTEHDPDRPLQSPDDIRNLLILCRRHHLGREAGIHEITFPVWLPQRATKPGAEVTPA
jgi:5-methylcytosine-specific restriction endonuclease McrA